MAKISLDLARFGWISTVFQNFLAGFCHYSYFLGQILAIFQILNPDRDPTTFRQEPSDSIWFSDWSATGLKIWNPTWSGRSRVGHKPNPDRLEVTPTCEHWTVVWTSKANPCLRFVGYGFRPSTLSLGLNNLVTVLLGMGS